MDLLARCLAAGCCVLLLTAAGCSDDTDCASCTDCGAADMALAGDQALCGPGTTQCGGKCTVTRSDPANCGKCGNSCATGQQCSGGKCTTVCPTGLSQCGGGDAGVLFCANLQQSNKNCGSCGNACSAGQVCSAGKCALSCQSGLSDCSGSCTNLKRDNKNCGSCGTSCKAGQVCSAGTCALSCQSGLTNCTELCVNLQSDSVNCGACGTKCKIGEVCTAGTCSLSCGAGLSDCSGSCTNLQGDNKNCGACGTTCKAGEVCSAGKCALSCQSGLTDCKGVCTNLKIDHTNCGVCGHGCVAGSYCSSGVCCKTGYTSCSGKCADLLNDKDNCGQCYVKCGTGKICIKGKCDNYLASCAAILAADSTAKSGIYTIRIGTAAAFEVHCDMTTDGGGWTRFWWYQANASLSGVKDVLGQDLSQCKTTDKKCLAVIPWAAPKQLMTTADNKAFQIYSFTSGSTSKRVLASLTKRTLWTTGAGDAWPPVKAVGTKVYKSAEGGGQARYWWYKTMGGIKSFNLDNDSGWAWTFFAAGRDSGNNLGVDHTDTGHNIPKDYNSEAKSLYLYAR